MAIHHIKTATLNAVVADFQNNKMVINNRIRIDKSDLSAFLNEEPNIIRYQQGNKIKEVVILKALNGQNNIQKERNSLYQYIVTTSNQENITPYSHDFTNWGLNQATGTITSDHSAGLVTRFPADLVTDISVSAAANVYIESIIPNDSTKWTFSIHIKHIDNPTVYPAIGIFLWGDGSIEAEIVVDPSTGEVINGSADSGIADKGSEIVISQDNGSTWYRVWLTIQNDSNGNTNLGHYFYPAYNDNGSSTGSSSITGSNLFTGAQLENASEPSPIIWTNGFARKRIL